jgi:hypothetical protein
MEPRLNCYESGPDAMKAMADLEPQIARSGLEKPLVEEEEEAAASRRVAPRRSPRPRRGVVPGAHDRLRHGIMASVLAPSAAWSVPSACAPSIHSRTGERDEGVHRRRVR